MIAFLYLTEDTPHQASLDKLIKLKQKIYIHPKSIERVAAKYRKYVIATVLPTKWGDYSLVAATIELLRAALENPQNEFFVLCSGDSVFIATPAMIARFLPQYSMFAFIEKKRAEYKTSQWFTLTRTDAETIVNTAAKYRRAKWSGSPDEYYMLSVLMAENKGHGNYRYTNAPTTFVKWHFAKTPIKHPYIYCRLTSYDRAEIADSGALFYRKIMSNREPAKIQKQYLDVLRTSQSEGSKTDKNRICDAGASRFSTKTVYILFIGTETPQNKWADIFCGESKTDYVIMTVFEDLKQIHPKLLESTIGIYKIIYKFYFSYVLEMCENESAILFLKQWKSVVFINEDADMIDVPRTPAFSNKGKPSRSQHNQQIKLPINVKNIFTQNKKIFYLLNDASENPKQIGYYIYSCDLSPPPA